MSGLAILMTEEELDARIEQKVALALAAAAAAGPKETLTLTEVCALLAVTRRTVLTFIQERGLPHTPIGPRKNRFIRSEVLAWWAKQKDWKKSHGSR